jgi:hypothetical protein
MMPPETPSKASPRNKTPSRKALKNLQVDEDRMDLTPTEVQP